MYGKYIEIISETFPKKQIEEILSTSKIFFEDCHVLYPADKDGMHLPRFFNIKPIIKSPQHHFVRWIIEDMTKWIKREVINADVIFAPNQSSVVTLVTELASTLGIRCVLWEYLPNGRFGEKFWGTTRINPGDKVIVFNGVTQQGRCIGQRLPEFAKKYGGKVAAVSAFARGSTGLIVEVEKMYGSKLYSTIRVEIPVYRADKCPKCLAGDTDSLQSWTDLVSP